MKRSWLIYKHACMTKSTRSSSRRLQSAMLSDVYKMTTGKCTLAGDVMTPETIGCVEWIDR
jgi:hypothetical protein